MWIKMTLSKVTVNSSLPSVELLEMIGIARCLTQLPVVKLTCEETMAVKSAPSVSNYAESLCA